MDWLITKNRLQGTRRRVLTELRKSQNSCVTSPVLCDTYLVTSQVISIVVKQLRYLLYIHSVVKGRGITNLPFVSWHLSLFSWATKDKKCKNLLLEHTVSLLSYTCNDPSAKGPKARTRVGVSKWDTKTSGLKTGMGFIERPGLKSGLGNGVFWSKKGSHQDKN